MGRFGSFLFGVVLGGAAVYAALMYHIVYASDGVHLVPKVSAGFHGIYTDIRGFGFSDWDEHKELAAALVKADKGYLLEDALANQVRGSVDGLLDGIGLTPSAPGP